MELEESFADGRFVWRIEGGSAYADDLVFSTPSGWSPDATHPDLHAVAALLALRPFVDGRLRLPRAVSPRFAEVAGVEFGIEVAPVDATLQPRHIEGGRVGLAYSGGVDSTAALRLLPDDTCCVFCEMEGPTDHRSTMYRPEAARHAVRAVADAGWDVVSVGTSVEHLGERIAFPVTDASSVESSGAPIALLADHLRVDAVAFGTVMEVTYGVGFGPFKDHLRNIEHRRWRRLLNAAGIDALLPLAGVSEVGAMRVVAASPLGDFAQSCVRGDAGRPCMNCVKCVRKTLTGAAISGVWPDADEIDRLILVPQFRTTLRRTPVPLADVYCYALSRCPVTSELIDLLKLRFGVSTSAAEYLERGYPPAAQAWPAGKRDVVADRIDQLLGTMSADDIGAFEASVTMHRERDEAVRTFAEELVDRLDALAGQPGRASGLVPAERAFLEIERPDTAELHEATQRLRRLNLEDWSAVPPPSPWSLLRRKAGDLRPMVKRVVHRARAALRD